MHRILIACLLLLAAAPAQADTYLDTLLDEARARGLAAHPYWHRLLHYQPNRLLGGVRSETEDPDFFLSPRGMREPDAELQATLRAFFDPDATTVTGEHPQCRFIARFHWLDEQLNLDEEHLPRQDCERFWTWHDAIDPGTATLIFASDYLNSPASMYGHTLLRIDPPGQDEDSRLVSYALNYAAESTEDNGFVFAYKGLTGGYIGRFSIMPYYEKVKEYNDWENRDLWEYRLQLKRPEVSRLLMHAWELGPIDFDYYFLHQNCSFRLLELLEVARPDLQLTDPFHFWAIPTDTVRVAIAQQALLDEVVYRPAASTILKHQIEQVLPHVAQLGHQLAHGTRTLDDPELAALPPEQQAEALEIAYAYLHYLFLSREVGTEARPHMHRLLVARSQVPVSRSRPQPPAPATRPDEGHDTARIALAGGELGERDFLELRLRPAYHDLLDPAAGYKHGAQIDFLDLALRRYQGGRIELEHLRLVDVRSLAPRDEFFREVSWNARIGLERQRLEDARRKLVLHGEAGGGLTFGLGEDDRHLFSVSLQNTVQLGDELEDDIRLGSGPSAQLLMAPRSGWRLLADARAQWFTDDGSPQWRLGLEQRVALGKNFALGLLAQREGAFDEINEEYSLSLHWYL